MIRYSKLWPFGNSINEFMTSFTDERDKGPIIKTHSYLLLGFALPFWFHVRSETIPPPLGSFTGILVLGVADSCASIFGKRFGKHLWPGTSRTVEGTLAAFLSLYLCVIVLTLVLGQFKEWMLFRCFISVLLTCLLEAWTNQIDNLVLPLYFDATLIFFTECLC